MKRPLILAAGSFAGISTVIMTFFGVNYYLVGLHSYAQGGVSQVPVWVYGLAGTMMGLILVSASVARYQRWDESNADSATGVSDASRPVGSGDHPQEMG